MSYSFINECGTCNKKDGCTDRHFIEGAISGIHMVWPSSKGHLGSGMIKLECSNLDPKQTEVTAQCCAAAIPECDKK